MPGNLSEYSRTHMHDLGLAGARGGLWRRDPVEGVVSPSFSLIE